MTRIGDWRPTANALPENHLRISLDTSGAVSGSEVATLALVIVATLVNDYQFAIVELVHAGRGSTTVEVSVEEKQVAATLEETQARIENLKADTRFKNVKALATGGALLAALATMAIDIADGESDLAKSISEVANLGAAKVCKFATGHACFELELPAPVEVNNATITAQEKGYDSAAFTLDSTAKIVDGERHKPSVRQAIDDRMPAKQSGHSETFPVTSKDRLDLSVLEGLRAAYPIPDKPLRDQSIEERWDREFDAQGSVSVLPDDRYIENIDLRNGMMICLGRYRSDIGMPALDMGGKLALLLGLSGRLPIQEGEFIEVNGVELEELRTQGNMVLVPLRFKKFRPR